MLRTISSLTFLYAVVIAALLVYGLSYYRAFRRGDVRRKRFPVVISIVAAACLFFLWINFNAPLSLRTFSNIDHQFLRHDGFLVDRSLGLGRSDTATNPLSSYNRFEFAPAAGGGQVRSEYSEDPFYVSEGNRFRIGSAHY